MQIQWTNVVQLNSYSELHFHWPVKLQHPNAMQRCTLNFLSEPFLHPPECWRMCSVLFCAQFVYVQIGWDDGVVSGEGGYITGGEASARPNHPHRQQPRPHPSLGPWQPVWLYLIWFGQYEEAHKDKSWAKSDQGRPNHPHRQQPRPHPSLVWMRSKIVTLTHLIWTTWGSTWRQIIKEASPSQTQSPSQTATKASSFSWTPCKQCDYI